jgi:hypothetical protein
MVKAIVVLIFLMICAAIGAFLWPYTINSWLALLGSRLRLSGGMVHCLDSFRVWAKQRALLRSSHGF